MKKVLLILMIFSFNSLIAQNVQPDWKFPIAFEDATGAKDTIWLIWDTTAVNAHDSIFGEFPINLTPNIFQVYFFLDMPATYDTCKIIAVESFWPISINIYAKNYTYPIKISWDSSLFHSSTIPSHVTCAEMDNDYFFFYGGPCQAFNMLTTDTVLAPIFNWGSQNQFPLSIRINREIGLCCFNAIEEKVHEDNLLSISPNPFTQSTQITLPQTYHNIALSVYDIQGKLLSQYQYKDCSQIQLNRNQLSNGLYFLKLTLDDKEVGTGKIVIRE